MRLQTMVHCLVECYGYEKEAWERFSAEDCAECALVVVERMLVKEHPEAREEWCFRGSVSLGVELVLAMTGMSTCSDQVRHAVLRIEVLRLASRRRSPRGARRPRRLHPPDYFGLCWDKMMEAHRPQLKALAEAIEPVDADFPAELLSCIAEFICDPFCRDAREGVELAYLVGFVDFGT